MPTETVYGLAAQLGSARAVARVFAAKDRPLFDPLIAHVATTDPGDAVASLVDWTAVDPAARAAFEVLTEALWPGPLTVVLPRSAAVPDLATGGLSTVGIRMPAHPVAQALLDAFGGPLVAPSANRFGRVSPTTAQAVQAELSGRVSLVLDGGPCAIGVESTVVAPTRQGVRLLRPGGVTAEQLETLVGPLLAPGGLQRASPGHDSSHYAPRTPLTVLSGPISAADPRALRMLAGADPVAVLRVLGPEAPARKALAGADLVAVRSLSETGDLAEAARHLFATLRALDDSGAARILVEPCPTEAGLGHAIADRLRRAARSG